MVAEYMSGGIPVAARHVMGWPCRVLYDEAWRPGLVLAGPPPVTLFWDGFAWMPLPTNLSTALSWDATGPVE